MSQIWQLSIEELNPLCNIFAKLFGLWLNRTFCLQAMIFCFDLSVAMIFLLLDEIYYIVDSTYRSQLSFMAKKKKKNV